MSPFPSDGQRDLLLTRKDLREDVFALVHRPEDFPDIPEELLKPQPPLDPGLSLSLEACFQSRPAGKQEHLKMEIDILRRLKRCRETERITRAYGVVNLVTPVKFRGKTVHAILSDPLKVGPWTEQEKQTLAKLCNLAPHKLPRGLMNATVFRAEQIESIARRQEQEASIMEALLTSISTEKKGSSPTAITSPAALDLLQPGFADHLNVLFRTIQKETTGTDSPLPESSRQRVEQALLRGCHLVDEIRKLTKEHQETVEWLSVHDILFTWSDFLKERHPSLRFTHNHHAEHDRIYTRIHVLNHLLFTLLSGVADSLPEATGTLGISTRNTTRNGRECLHLEIRDGGGLATFAGVGRPLDQEIIVEQNEEIQSSSDWMALAQQIDADLQVLREDGTVSRIEMWIYPENPDEYSEENEFEGPAVWVVEDEDREFNNLQYMLSEAGIHPTRLTSGSELRSFYPSATTPPSLVILKYLLPDERGANLRTWLYEQDPDLPVILVSAFTGTHPGIATAVNLPSTLFLQKPYDSQALLDMLRMTVDDTLSGIE